MRLTCVLGLLICAANSAWGRGGGGCLEQGTLIQTPTGQVPVEQLAVGDRVWTTIDGSLQTGIVRARVEVAPREYCELTAGDHTLRITREHPIQTRPGMFRAAAQLRPGDTITVRTHDQLQIARLSSVVRVQAKRPAYNLLVAPGGTFLANGIVVHNKGCFLPDTPILRSDGSATSISAIRPGDDLLAFTAEGAIVRATVNQILTHDVDEYAVVTTEHITLRVTPEHPFYVGDGTFKTLEALKVGDRIYAYDGHGLTAQTISSIARVRSRTRVYNLQTDAPHTFFANGIAVHNKGGGCFPAGTLIETPRGEIAIEQLEPGDAVIALRRDGRPITAQVQGVFSTRSPLLILNTDRGELRTTAEHPLRLARGNFRPAGDLAPGENVLIWQARRLQPARIIARQLLTTPCLVYNLEVGWPHTFVADGFVVHNKGGGFGGGYHGGGSGGGDAPPGAVIGLLILIVVIVIIANAAAAKKKKDEDLDFVYSPAAVVPKAIKTQQLLTFIAKTDPTFARETLEQLAQSCFVTLQQCWQARHYDPMKPLLMPDLYAEHCAQIAGMIRSHEINLIENLRVERVDIVNVRYTHQENQREFTALVTASARDYYIDDRTREFQRGDEVPARFQEFWTFQRQDGAWLLREIEQSRESDALKLENFFEPFTDDGLRQVYAETASPGGPAGPWLEKETEAKTTRIERLLNFLVQTDKLWDRDQMIERARKIFTEVVLARESGDPAAVPTPELFPDVAAHLQAEIIQRQTTGATIELRNFCVRKVELVLVRNYRDNRADEFTARISAHAQRIVRRKNLLISQDEYVSPFVEFWTFGRLDDQWKLKEVLPPARGQAALAQENVDEESSAEQLQWYYQKTRAT